MQSLVKMRSARRYCEPAWWFCIAIVTFFACGTSGSGTSPPGAAPSQRAEQNPSPSPSPSPGQSPTPSPPATACTSDGECNFADPCQPVRCVASPARAACSQPTTPSGSCVCFEGSCAMRPSSPRISKQSCKDTGDCAVDVTTAECEPGIVPDGEFRVRFSGPTCRCSPSDHHCHLYWFDPVPCGSTDDCWLDDRPVVHAIRRPPRLKGRKFRGCVDGESVPACVDGRCTLRALRC